MKAKFKIIKLFYCIIVATVLISCGPSEEEIRKQKYIESRIQYWSSLNKNLNPTLLRQLAEEDWELSKGGTQSETKGLMDATGVH